MSDIRMIKFETVIEDMNMKIRERTINAVTAMNAVRRPSFFADIKTKTLADFFYLMRLSPLHVIFDDEKLNEYGKIIISKAYIEVPSGWEEQYNSGNIKDAKMRINAVRKLIEYYKTSTTSTTAGYKFVFWALMILTVDKTDAEEHLSLICDFARMLHISDEEMEDMVNVIKMVYHHEKTEIRTEKIRSIFGGLLDA